VEDLGSKLGWVEETTQNVEAVKRKIKMEQLSCGCCGVHFNGALSGCVK